MFNSGFTNKTAYKVIRPFTSQKLHFSSSLEGGASKCYREVKSLMPNSTNFSVMNMTTNELYDYKLNKIPNQLNGGILPSLDIKKLEEKMESLEKRVKTLEDKSEHKIENLDHELDKTKINDNNLQLSEKIIQTSPKASPKASPKNMVIAPGPINSDFAKAFL